ncbi:MAG: diaminopimelate epimerase [Lachnospiraceae bacterium]|nr:diaminopimelate epimerase [Lachnospiraceae bacterium]
MHFTKMHGLGNDYLYVYGEVPENIEDLSIKLSDRHFGAGSDGMIYISPSDVADFKMRIFNADGSEAKMCGNGIRCVGKYVYDKGYTDVTKITVETLSGIKKLHLHLMGSVVGSVSVKMGKGEAKDDLLLEIDNKNACFTAQRYLIPVLNDSDKKSNVYISDDKFFVNAVPVSTGNPHAVVFVDDAENIPLSFLGPLCEHHEAFPDGVNTEFVEVLSRNELRMRVWERGSGITMACGTGACASAFASVKKKYCDYDTPIKVHLDGGTLVITIASDETITMEGPATTVYEGDYK